MPSGPHALGSLLLLINVAIKVPMSSNGCNEHFGDIAHIATTGGHDPHIRINFLVVGHVDASRGEQITPLAYGRNWLAMLIGLFDEVDRLRRSNQRCRALLTAGDEYGVVDHRRSIGCRLV